MKEFLCVFLSGSLVLTTSCSTKTKQEHRPQPATPMSEQQVKTTEKDLEEQGNEQAKDAGKGPKAYSKAKQYLDTAVEAMMANSEMRIKDFAGKDVSITAYKANPTQAFVLFPEESGYSALKTSVDLEALKSLQAKDMKSVKLTYEIFAMDGTMEDFKGENLDEPVVVDSMDVDTINAAANLTKMRSLFERLKSSSYAANSSMFKTLGNFLFPTAYADMDSSDLMTAAIVFTSVAILSYIFAFYTIGDISTAAAIVFWLLFAFNDKD